MRPIITEELRLRKRICEFAIKHGNNAEAARRYHTSRQQVQRWLKRYDGTLDSLRPLSRRPHTQPNQHTTAELAMVRQMNTRYRHEGLAQVYVESCKRGYTRSYGSMCRQIRKHQFTVKKVKNFPKSKWKPDVVSYPGEKVQMDIKYVPRKCIEENPNETQYYQITAIDEYSRKRVAAIVDEKSVTHTSEFLLTLESKMGFKISTVQTDNGREFTNMGSSERICQFDMVAKWLKIEHKTTRPFSPWQNGKVERSHRRDGESFYNRSFRTIEVLCKAHKRYISRYNNIVQRTLGFKSPNELVTEFFLAHSA